MVQLKSLNKAKIEAKINKKLTKSLETPNTKKRILNRQTLGCKVTVYVWHNGPAHKSRIYSDHHGHKTQNYSWKWRTLML